jgi:hopanoid biosynthesis associated protein HpnK
MLVKAASMDGLIVTADDFGAAPEVNEAVEQAHRNGILTAASLMVNGAAAADAVERARTLPLLGIGLHLVLVEGRPTLPPAEIPDLVDSNGLFRTNMVKAGIDIFFRPSVRRQLAAEIDAQFEAFAATGLPLDHVNAHKHFHLHPTIAGLIMAIGPRYGMTAMRAPIEPRAILCGIEPGTTTIAERIAAPYARAVRSRIRRAGMLVPDQVFGLAWSGAMSAKRVAALIERLPSGLSEIYLHPAMSDDFADHAPGYRYRAEYDALVDIAVEEAARGIRRGSFSDFRSRAEAV